MRLYAFNRYSQHSSDRLPGARNPEGLNTREPTGVRMTAVGRSPVMTMASQREGGLGDGPRNWLSQRKQ